MLGSTFAKTRVRALGASPTVCALAGGLVGGVAQSIVMTPAGMIFTSVSTDRKLSGSLKSGLH